MNTHLKYLFGANSNGTPPVVLPDFSGLNITRMYSIFKTNLATIDYICKIQLLSGTGSEYYVFFDDNFELSLNSKVSLTTTIGTQSLNDIIGSDFWQINEIYCQITGHALIKNIDNTARLIENIGDFTYKNSKPIFNFRGVSSGYFDGLALNELNTGNNFSISVVANLEAGGDFNNLIVSSNNVLNQKLAVLMDGRSVGRNILQIKNTSDVLDVNNNYLVTENTTNQRRLLNTVIDLGACESYYNNIFQESNSLTGPFLNDVLRVGASQLGGVPYFKGGLQFLAIMNTNINTTQRNDLDTKLDNYFNF